MAVTSTIIELKNYIGGEWRQAKGDDVNVVINPANQEVIARAPRATKEETEEAISVARTAFESGIWSNMTTYERAAYLNKIADKIEENLDELATLEVMDNGKIKTEAEFDIADAAGCFRYYAGLIMHLKVKHTKCLKMYRQWS